MKDCLPGMPCKVVAALPFGLEPLDHAIPERPSPSTKSWVAVEALKIHHDHNGSSRFLFGTSGEVVHEKSFKSNPKRTVTEGFSALEQLSS